MDELKRRLIADFQHVESVNETTGVIQFRSNWAGKTSGVKKIVVYLSGQNPLTGEPVDDLGIGFAYSMAYTSGTSRPAVFYGDFLLRYDAVLDDGRQIHDFIPERKIMLRVPGVRPQLYYSVTQEKYGYSRIIVKGNCLQRCNGCLWIQYQGGFCRIPKMSPGNNNSFTFYFPGQGGIVLLSDASLPTPILMKGSVVER